MRSVCLMYHDVFVGESPAPEAGPGAARYHVPADAFRRHLEIVAPACREGRVTLTFDDGWRGSLSTGVELLADAGLRASFFVTRDFVGRPGYADERLLREAHAAGMEIGTHGVTHVFLTSLPPEDAKAELASCKAFLEDVVGAEVTTGSVPGGAWSPAVAVAAARCGHGRLYTSRPGVNDEHTDPFRLCRIPIRRGTSDTALRRYARLDVGRETARAKVLDAPRTLLGRERYARLRSRLLR